MYKKYFKEGMIKSKASDLTSPFITIDENGNNAVGFKTSANETFELTPDQAIKWSNELKTIATQILEEENA